MCGGEDTGTNGRGLEQPGQGEQGFVTCGALHAPMGHHSSPAGSGGLGQALSTPCSGEGAPHGPRRSGGLTGLGADSSRTFPATGLLGLSLGCFFRGAVLVWAASPYRHFLQEAGSLRSRPQQICCVVRTGFLFPLSSRDRLPGVSSVRSLIPSWAPPSWSHYPQRPHLLPPSPGG